MSVTAIRGGGGWGGGVGAGCVGGLGGLQTAGLTLGQVLALLRRPSPLVALAAPATGRVALVRILNDPEAAAPAAAREGAETPPPPPTPARAARTPRGEDSERPTAPFRSRTATPAPLDAYTDAIMPLKSSAAGGGAAGPREGRANAAAAAAAAAAGGDAAGSESGSRSFVSALSELPPVSTRSSRSAAAGGGGGGSLRSATEEYQTPRRWAGRRAPGAMARTAVARRGTQWAWSRGPIGRRAARRPRGGRQLCRRRECPPAAWPVGTAAATREPRERERARARLGVPGPVATREPVCLPACLS